MNGPEPAMTAENVSSSPHGRSADVDTVEHAAISPEQAQPYADLGLKEDEYAHIRELLGRGPTNAELAMYSVLWSEHCSYTPSTKHLRTSRQHAPPTTLAMVLVCIAAVPGIVVEVSAGAPTSPVESHPPPPAALPSLAGAFSAGGLVRAASSMGARP